MITILLHICYYVYNTYTLYIIHPHTHYCPCKSVKKLLMLVLGTVYQIYGYEEKAADLLPEDILSIEYHV